MILRNIDIEHFGRFSGASFEFRRGMNLVSGPNEAGKSTLAEAVIAVLFGSRQVERFKPWGRAGCSARLVFEGDGRVLDLQRNLLTDEVCLVEQDDLYQVLSRFEGRVPSRGRSAACREYRDLLDRLLGVSDEELFRATCFFGQQPAEWTDETLGAKLRELVSGAEEIDYAGILDSLLEEHFLLTRENPWGRDKKRDRELECLLKQYESAADVSVKARSPVTFSFDSEGDAQERTAEIRRLEAEIEHDRAEYVKGVCYIDRLRETLAETEPPQSVPGGESDVQIIAAEAAQPSRDALREKLTAAGLPPDPPESLYEMLQEAAAIRQELTEIQQPLNQLIQDEGQVHPVPWSRLGLFSLLLVCGGAAAALFSPWFWVGPALAAAGLGGCAGWGGMRSRRRRRQLEKLAQRRTVLEQERAVVVGRQELLTEHCEAAGLPSSAIDLVRLQKAAEAHRDLLDAWWRSTSPAVTATDELPTPEAADAVSSPETAGEETEGDLAELEQRLVEFAAQLKKKEQLLVRLKNQPETAPDSSATTNTGEAAALQERIAQVRQRIAVLRTAIDLLVAGVESFRQSHLKDLTDEAGRLFARMTGGRYTQIRLDDEMRPEVKVAERRWQPADRLSRGTLDVLYLALRIGLAKVRSDGRQLPLLLDDPFVHMDSRRLKSVMGLLDVAAADGQMIVFSHSDSLGRRAARERWHLVSLGDDAGDVEKEEDHVGQLHLL